MRLACVDIPAFPLQRMLSKHPQWAGDACVVVKDDRPHAEIFWANRQARVLGIQRGMRFGEAQALASTLHAAVHDPKDVAQATETVWRLLLQFTPNVEPADGMPGIFWLDPNGLTQVFGSLDAWLATVHEALTQAGWFNTVAVGFNRYYVFAVARGSRQSVVMPDAAAEKAWAQRVPLKQLDVSFKLLDALSPLGLHTLGDLLALPVSELRQRVGEEAERIHRLVNETLWAPLRPQRPVEPYQVELQIEPADANHERLMFGIKGMLPKLLAQLQQDSSALVGLQGCFELDHHAPFTFQLEPAAPTLDEKVLLELVRLRLSASTVPAPVKTMQLTALALPLKAEQLQMLQQRPKRDLRAAAQALAKLRAALGETAVTRAELRASHLPEASFVWQPIHETVLPQRVGAEQLPPLMRRLVTPTLLPPRPRHDPSAWLGDRGTITNMVGPFRVTTAWWAKPQARDYYYLSTQCGDILWTYYDRMVRRWFLHGIVD